MKRTNKRRGMNQFIPIIMVIVLIMICVGVSIPFNFNDHTYVVSVIDKERVVSDDSSKYLVYCDDAKSSESLVFQNTDTFLRFKFDSSNMQGGLKINHEYKITVVGLRIPFFSMYENIIEVEEIK